MLSYGDAGSQEGLQYSLNKKNNQKFSNLIAGKTKAGINTSKFLFKITNYDSNLIEKLKKIQEDLIWQIPMIALTACLAFHQVVKMRHG